MNFDSFWIALKALEESVAITSPVTAQVKRAYWGAPAGQALDLPCAINALSEPERTLGLGNRREQRMQVRLQLLAARATPEDEQSSRIATAFWFAAKSKFDADTSIGGTVMFSTLRGADPTVPVILQHAGQGYIGFDAILEIQQIEMF